MNPCFTTWKKLSISVTGTQKVIIYCVFVQQIQVLCQAHFYNCPNTCRQNIATLLKDKHSNTWHSFRRCFFFWRELFPPSWPYQSWFEGKWWIRTKLSGQQIPIKNTNFKQNYIIIAYYFTLFEQCFRINTSFLRFNHFTTCNVDLG